MRDALFLAETREKVRFVEDFVNAGPLIRDAIRIRLMKEWRMRARCPLVAKGYPAWKCRKNYLALVRKHTALAKLAGCRESDVYLYL